MRLDRRQWLARMAAGGAGVILPFGRQAAEAAEAKAAPSPAPRPRPRPSPSPAQGELLLKDFQPRSMLHVEEHRVERARFPVIDVHAHFSWSGGLKGTDTITFLAGPPEILPVMDRKNVRTMCNLTAGTGPALQASIKRFDQAAPGR